MFVQVVLRKSLLCLLLLQFLFLQFLRFLSLAITKVATQRAPGSLHQLCRLKGKFVLILVIAHCIDKNV